MKLTKQNIEKADRIQKVESANEVNNTSFMGRIAKAMVSEHGFYGYTDLMNGKNEKVLIITNACYNGLVN